MATGSKIVISKIETTGHLLSLRYKISSSPPRPLLPLLLTRFINTQNHPSKLPPITKKEASILTLAVFTPNRNPPLHPHSCPSSASHSPFPNPITDTAPHDATASTEPSQTPYSNKQTHEIPTLLNTPQISNPRSATQKLLKITQITIIWIHRKAHNDHQRFHPSTPSSFLSLSLSLSFQIPTSSTSPPPVGKEPKKQECTTFCS